MEIERRWISYDCSGISFGDNDYLETAYVESDIGPIRLRYKHTPHKERYYINIKNGTGLSRIEIEKDLSKEEFYALANKSNAKFVKTPYLRVPSMVDGINDLEFKKMGNQIVLEIEFDSEEEANNFVLGQVKDVLPEGNWKEVTELKGYNFYDWYRKETNAMLSILMKSSGMEYAFWKDVMNAGVIFGHDKAKALIDNYDTYSLGYINGIDYRRLNEEYTEKYPSETIKRTNGQQKEETCE